MKFHRGRWVGTSFLFIGRMISDSVYFLLKSTRKGRLITGAVIFFIGKPLSVINAGFILFRLLKPN